MCYFETTACKDMTVESRVQCGTITTSGATFNELLGRYNFSVDPIVSDRIPFTATLKL